MGIEVSRQQGVGECTGGQVIGDIAHTCPWPAAVVAITIDGGHGIWMDRDTAYRVANEIIEALVDG